MEEHFVDHPVAHAGDELLLIEEDRLHRRLCAAQNDGEGAQAQDQVDACGGYRADRGGHEKFHLLRPLRLILAEVYVHRFRVHLLARLARDP